MRVLFSIQPGIGHLHPAARLAASLTGAGHEVAVASAPSFTPDVEAFGLTAFPAGRDWTEAEVDRTFPGFTEMQGLEQVRIFAELSGQGIVDDLVEIGRRWHPDVIVRETFEWGGWMAAELIDLPHAVMSIGIGVPREIVQVMAGDLLGEVPSTYGLPPDPALERSERYLYLVGSPGSLDPPGLPRGSTHRRIRPLVLEANSEAPSPLPSPVKERPLVHATLGTVFNKKARILQAIVDALADEDVDLIVSVGRDGRPDELTPAANARIERFVSHPDLLPHCDLLITHGGHGTAMAAASAGVPACLLPISADQPLTSVGYASTGAAINLATEVPEGGAWPIIDPERVEPEAIRQAARQILDNPDFRSAALRLRDEVEALPSADVAVGFLEQIVETGEPVA
jgi:UDP:flavonoid glycosyltransferase YjiC (YdhE family)